jgi:hypothetical protein
MLRRGGRRRSVGCLPELLRRYESSGKRRRPGRPHILDDLKTREIAGSARDYKGRLGGILLGPFATQDPDRHANRI